MKGTAMVVVATVASASSCDFVVPPAMIQHGAQLSQFSCDDVSTSCCSGLVDTETRIINGKGANMQDFIGTCGRADQVNMYNCAVKTLPRVVPPHYVGKAEAMIHAKGCPHVAVSSGKDGSGQCALTVLQSAPDFRVLARTFQINDVSKPCCSRFQAYADARKPGPVTPEFLAVLHQAECGLIGACGKQDQESIAKFVQKELVQKHNGSKVQLLETFNFPVGGAAETMASFMPSEVEETIGDGATDDGSQIMTGLLGFVAGAAVTGLGVTILRHATHPQDEYSEVVA